MALACDLRIAVPGAKFFYPVMKLGFLPQPSDPGRLAALVGPSRAKLMLMGGQKLTVEEAYAFGLVDRIVAPEALMEQARMLAADTLAAPEEVAQGIKALCRGGSWPARSVPPTHPPRHAAGRIYRRARRLPGTREAKEGGRFCTQVMNLASLGWVLSASIVL